MELTQAGAKVSATNPLPFEPKTATTITATIAQNQALSGAIDLGSASLLAIAMPAAWDAAKLTFQASDSLAGTYQNVYDDAGFEVTVTAAAARVIAVDVAALKLGALRYVKIRSGTAAVAVNQTAARTLTLLVK